MDDPNTQKRTLAEYERIIDLRNRRREINAAKTRARAARIRAEKEAEEFRRTYHHVLGESRARAARTLARKKMHLEPDSPKTLRTSATSRPTCSFGRP